MKNWKIAASGLRSLWGEEGAVGVTWFAAALETDKKGFLCFFCLAGIIIFDIEVRKIS